MIKIVSVEEMAAIEAATDASGVSYDDMMERAGRAVASVVLEHLGENLDGKRVVILAGPGNNGGDGLVAARILSEGASLEVSCYLSRPRGEDDAQLTAARDAGVFIVDAANDQRWRVLRNLVASADVLVDALLGTGTRLPLRDEIGKLLVQVEIALAERRAIGTEDAPKSPAAPGRAGGLETVVIAVDCPTGLDCDTGDLDPAAIPADVTVAFAAAKHGHVRFPGAPAVGRLRMADIGVPPRLPEWQAVKLELADSQDVRAALPARPDDGHKGTFGRAAIVAGSANYTGAAHLAGLAAYRAGAGLVTMAVPGTIHATLAGLLPEATWLPLPDEAGTLNGEAGEAFLQGVGEAAVWLVGPGVGRSNGTSAFVSRLLDSEVTLPPASVVDADGLNILADLGDWWARVPQGTVLTPHPGEMARLAGTDTASVQADRVAVATEKAAQWECVVVLKGAFTVVASPDGRVVVLPFASSALAKAGTGDVLAGTITGLLAQGASPFDAALAGAYVHGLAGQIAAAHAGSRRSVLAREVADALGAALGELELPG